MKQNHQSLSQQINDVKSELSEIRTEVADLKLSLEHVDNEVETIRDETIPTLRKDLMKEIKTLKDQRLEAELYSKKANLLFYGIEETHGEDCESTIRNFLKTELRHEQADTMLFVNTHRLPTRATNGKPKPIIVKFVQMKDRDSVLGRAFNLRNSKTSKKFGISPHLPKEMQVQRQNLLPVKRQAIAAGKKAIIKTKGTLVQLFINDRIYDPIFAPFDSTK